MLLTLIEIKISRKAQMVGVRRTVAAGEAGLLGN
jgi:hypothetical protein